MQKRMIWKTSFLVAPVIGMTVALTASAQSVATTITQGPGSYSRNTTVTGANGRTATYQDNRAWGTSAYTNTRSYSGFNGAKRTDSISRSGGIVTNTITGRNENSRTFVHSARYRR